MERKGEGAECGRPTLSTSVPRLMPPSKKICVFDDLISPGYFSWSC